MPQEFKIQKKTKNCINNSQIQFLKLKDTIKFNLKATITNCFTLFKK